MKPTAADTESGMRTNASATTPPSSASGTLSKMTAASNSELNAENKSKNVIMSASGITSSSRAMARCWFSNSPPQTS